MNSLSQASLNKSFKIKHIKDGDLKLKFYEMGLYPKQEVVVIKKAPFGDPLAVKVGDQVIMLRTSEANQIEIEE